MKIYLIRHWETTWDIEDRFGGDYDDHLTEKGKEQAQELANKLLGKGITIIYSSPKIRACETSNEVANILNIPVIILDDLRERNNYWVLSGMTKDEAKQKYPEEFEKILKDKTYHDVMGSESYGEIKKRVLNIFSDIVKQQKDTIAIISHGGVISTYVREYLTDGKNIKLRDCEILELVNENGYVRIESFENAKLSSHLTLKVEK